MDPAGAGRLRGFRALYIAWLKRIADERRITAQRPPARIREVSQQQNLQPPTVVVFGERIADGPGGAEALVEIGVRLRPLYRAGELVDLPKTAANPHG